MGDPEDHIHMFHAGMEDVTQHGDIWCRMFRCTLVGDAIGWYRALPMDSVQSFEHLVKAFRVAFNHRLREKVVPGTLLNVRQRKDETLKEYMTRFAAAAQRVDNVQDSNIVMALQSGLRANAYAASLTRNPVSTLAEAMERAQTEIHVESMYTGKKERDTEERKSSPKRKEGPLFNRERVVPKRRSHKGPGPEGECRMNPHTPSGQIRGCRTSDRSLSQTK